LNEERTNEKFENLREFVKSENSEKNFIFFSKKSENEFISEKNSRDFKEN
jgi:hypothetical protein